MYYAINITMTTSESNNGSTTIHVDIKSSPLSSTDATHFTMTQHPHVISRIATVLLLLVITSLLDAATADNEAQSNNPSSDIDTAAQKLRKLCRQGAKPSFIEGVNFESLDTTPNGGRDWFAWVKQNAQYILEESPRSRYVTSKEDADERPNMFGRKINVERYESQEQLLQTLEQGGYVANLVHIQDMKEFAPKMEAVEEATGRRLADADFYIARPGAGSYGWHFDDVDNLVYCVNGTKRFRVAGTEVGSPVVVDVYMEPGDAVWVPTGNYHIGVGGDEPSIIFSIGFVNTYWEDTFGEHFLDKKGKFDKEMAFEMMEAQNSILSWEEIGALRHGHTLDEL